MRSILIVTAGILASCAGVASGAKYSSSDGYSFQYPDGWIAMDKDRQQGARLPPGTDLSRFSCTVVNPNMGLHGFSANVNMVVAQGRMSDSDLDKAGQENLRQLSSMGVPTFNLRTQKRTVAGCKALCMDYDWRVPGPGLFIHQQQFLISGGSKVYTLTCTAAADEFEFHRPSFQMMVDSLTFPSGMPSWLTGAIVVGVVGAVVGGIAVIKTLRHKAAGPMAGAAAVPAAASASAAPQPGLAQPPAAQAPPAAATTITVVCACGQILSVSAAMSGQKGRCPHCNGIVDIP